VTKKIFSFIGHLLLVGLVGCTDVNNVSIASFESVDAANKVMVLLEKNGIGAEFNKSKDRYDILVAKEEEIASRKLLSRFNFYFEELNLSDLLDSKFASLSKLELVKGNLLESRQIANKLGVIPDVLKVNVIITGEEDDKRISVLVISLTEFEQGRKNNIERFLRGVASSSAKLTVSYYVQGD